jgi:hypothetical protein
MPSFQFVRNAQTVFFDSARKPLTDAESKLLLDLSIVSAFSFAGLLILWLLWFFLVIFLTRRALRKLPYASHRFQQLCYRFFLFQKLVIVAFVVTLDTIPVVSFLSSYYKYVPVAGTSLLCHATSRCNLQ